MENSNGKTKFEKLVYPIKGRIVSEFDIIEESRGRFDDEKVKIENQEWLINIEKREEHLGVYLKCLFQGLGTGHADDRDEIRVLMKFTIRLINHLDSSKTVSRSFEHQYMEDTGCGYSKFEKWEDLLDGGYLKDDKFTVECFLSVLSEPVPISDFKNDRPNVQDLKTIFEPFNNQLTSPITGVIKEYIDVESVKEELTFTDTHLIGNVPCKIWYKKVTRDDVVWFAVFTYLNSEDESEWWGCDAQTGFWIKNQNDVTKSVYDRALVNHLYYDSNIWGYQLIKWNDLINAENGFVKNGKFILEAHVQISTKQGFDKRTGKGIDKPMKTMTDAVLEVDGEYLYVSKQILAQQSSHFDRLFSTDPARTEFEVTNVNAFDFIHFLCLVHNSETRINESNLKAVLEVIDRFQAPECFERCDYIMKRQPLSRPLELLSLIDKYSLPELQGKVLKELYHNSTLEKVAASEEYRKLKAETKITIFKWKLPEKLRPEQEDSSNYKFNIDFKKESKHSDIKITVDGIHFYASKPILANASAYFMREFYGPKATDATEIELFDIRPLQFEKLLTHIYHPTRPVTSGNVDSLLLLAHQYSVPRLSSKCEEYLVLRSRMPLVDKFEYAGKYNLPFLMNYCLNIFENDEDEKKTLMESPKYHRLSTSVFGEIGQREACRKYWNN